MIDTIVIRAKTAPDFHPFPSVVRWRTVTGAGTPWTKWHGVLSLSGGLLCKHAGVIPASSSRMFSPVYDREGVPTCKKCLRSA